jgi:hypothetical protein
VNRINQLLSALAFAALAGCSGGSSQTTFTSTPPRQLSLKFDSQPGSGLAGEALSFEVSIRDRSGQVTGGGSVTVALAANSPGGALEGTLTRPAVNGVATFDDIVIVKAGQGYTLTATSPGMAGATTSAFTLAYSADENETTSGSNDTPEGAVPIAPGIPMFGNLSAPDDVDYYKFHASAGQIVSVSSYATRLDLGRFDAQGIYHGWDTSLRLRLIGPDKQTELQRMSADDWPRFSIDNEMAAVRIPKDDDYYLACDVDSSGAATGRYALLLKISDPPAGVQLESEPAGGGGLNDTRATAQALSPGYAYGQYQTPGTTANDSDFYKIVVAEPTHLHLDLIASRNGVAGADGVAWDPVIELQDASGDLTAPGTTLWVNDDTAFNDPAIDYVVTIPGTYFVRVGRFGVDDGGSAPYLLSYQASPVSIEQAASANPALPTALAYGQTIRSAFAGPAGGIQYFAFSGSAGDLVRLWIDDQSNLQGSQLLMGPSHPADAMFVDGETQSPLAAGTSTFVSAPPGNSELNVQQIMLETTGTQLVRVSSPQPGEFGIRLELVASGAAILSGTLPNNPAPADNKNHHPVHAEEGQLVTISLFANAESTTCGSQNFASALGDCGSLLCPTVQVFDGAGKLLSSTSADRPGQSNFAESMLRPDAMLETTFRAPAAGSYDVVVSDANNLGGSAYFYALQVWKNQ